MRQLTWVLTVWAVVGCNANLKVHTSGGEINDPAGLTPPEEEKNQENEDKPAPEFVGEFTFTRSYIQSRSVITLQLNSQLIQDGERFTLWNETTKAKLLDSDEASLAFTDGRLLMTSGGFSLINFAPAGFSNGITYGVNDIRLDIGDEYTPRYATSKLTLHDFPIFELGLTHFGENVQTKGNFQGWINTVSQPMVSSTQGTTLTVGMPNIINR